MALSVVDKDGCSLVWCDWIDWSKDDVELVSRICV
jgi:hypothetical protein